MSDYNFLVSKLKEAYNTKENGMKMKRIHLFGIKYANILEGVNLGQLSIDATGKESFKIEIRKGMKISRFVEII
ncbi:MAG TPA: hypothetical protein GX012_02815 [Acholeplasma sp.]|nr:hypothetical protein [Acholeplasma sp.]